MNIVILVAGTVFIAGAIFAIAYSFYRDGKNTGRTQGVDEGRKLAFLDLLNERDEAKGFQHKLAEAMRTLSDGQELVVMSGGMAIASTSETGYDVKMYVSLTGLLRLNFVFLLNPPGNKKPLYWFTWDSTNLVIEIKNCVT